MNHSNASIQYALRANFFGYNDETYYVAGHQIQQIYDDLAQAKAALFALELENARQFELYEVDSFFNADDSFIEKMDAFVFERCGEHIAENGEVIEGTIPEALSDADTVEFVQMAGMNSYQIIEVPTDKLFYALWLTGQQQYALNHDESGTSLIYAESAQQLLDKQLENVMYTLDDALTLSGTLEQLSDSPTLLQAAIDSQKNLSYNSKTQQLQIKDYDPQALRAVHELLKSPLYEVRTLSLPELIQLEQQHADDPYAWDE
ncbi:MAG: hypothetical protein WA154_05665 [Moraxellaceae bacterium]